LRSGEANAGIERRGDGAAIGEAIALKQIEAVAVLREVQSACLAIPDDLDAELERSRA
jgi:hypothetical protein